MFPSFVIKLDILRGQSARSLIWGQQFWTPVMTTCESHWETIWGLYKIVYD